MFGFLLNLQQFKQWTTQNIYANPSLYIIDGSIRLVLVFCRQTVTPDRHSPPKYNRSKTDTTGSVTSYIR